MWKLLDDIDTASDMFKPSDDTGYRAFYEYAMRKQELRHKYIHSDGYNLKFNIREDNLNGDKQAPHAE